MEQSKKRSGYLSTINLKVYAQKMWEHFNFPLKLDFIFLCVHSSGMNILGAMGVGHEIYPEDQRIVTGSVAHALGKIRHNLNKYYRISIKEGGGHSPAGIDFMAHSHGMLI